MADGRTTDWSRRLALAALAGAPLAAAAALSGRARAALVGARGFTDSGAAAGAFPKVLRGPAGDERILAAPPRRIASTYLGADELLAALVSADRVVGVSAYADDPATSNCHDAYPPHIPRLRTDPETVISLAPDLVCVAGYTASDPLRLLVGAGLAVVRWSRFDSFTEVMAAIRVLGAAVGEEARAAALAGTIAALLGDLERRLAGVRPVRVLYYDPPTYTMGTGTLVDEILTRAGGKNAVRDLGIAGPGQIGLETVLALEPEAIITPNYAGNESTLRALGADAIWRQVPAVRAGRVYEVPGAWIATVSHHAAQGLGRVARVLHPEVFSSVIGPDPSP
jgi:iron complex transport system substrate-binding protein